MNRALPIVIAGVSAIWMLWLLVYGLAPLPDPMVSQFGFDGRPSSAMSKGAFRLIMGGITAWMIIIMLAVGILRHLPDRLINIPNRDHWLTGERREATIAIVIDFTRWIMALTVAFLAGVTWAVIDAHASSPPRLSTAFFWLLAVFVVGMAALTLRFVGRFARRVDSGR